jgi:hypothetical protein
MASLYLFNIDKLKSDFQQLLHIQHEIINRKFAISNKLAELKETYSNLVKTNTKKIFLFCLDSFFFQYKTLSIEMENLCKFISLINNRMYGDYYKLYNIILLQTADANIDVRGLISEAAKKYPTYKDLEPFYEYKISDIISLHADILKLVNYLYTHYSGKEQNIIGYQTNTNVGLSISSFLNTLEYENTLLREQIALYVGYISFFHSSQKGYLTRAFSKIQNFQREIDDDLMKTHQSTNLNNSSLHEVSNTLDNPDMEAFFKLTTEEPTEIESLLLESEKVLASGDEVINELEESESVDDIPEGAEGNEGEEKEVENIELIEAENQYKGPVAIRAEEEIELEIRAQPV